MLGLSNSRAVVVNSNMSRGNSKYLSREGPGSRPGKVELLAKPSIRDVSEISKSITLTVSVVVHELQRDDFVKDGGGSSARTIAFYGLDDRLCYNTSDRPHTKVDRAALAISYETVGLRQWHSCIVCMPRLEKKPVLCNLSINGISCGSKVIILFW